MNRSSKCASLLKQYPLDFPKLQRLYSKKSRTSPPIWNLLGESADPRWTPEDRKELLLLYYFEPELVYGSPDNSKLFEEAIYSDDFEVFRLLCNSPIAGVDIPRVLLTIFESFNNPLDCYKYCKCFIDTSNDQEFMMLFCVKWLIKYGVIEKDREEKGEYINSIRHFDEEKHTKLLKILIFYKRHNSDIINKLLLIAIKYGANYELVNLLVELGADVNYQLEEYDSCLQLPNFKTPLKLAIDKNSKDVVDLLYKNGASLERPNITPQAREYINTLGKGAEKQTHKYHDFYERVAYGHCTQAPVEYAVNLRDALIMYCTSSIRVKPRKFVEDRVAIVKRIYEATLDKGSCEIDYTSLICFAIDADNEASITYYFEEAKKRQQQLDFERIIDSIHTPGIFHVPASTLTEVVRTPIFYKTQDHGASEWLKKCYKYSKELDANNHKRNVSLLLKQIFKICYYGGNIEQYKKLIIQYSSELTPDEIIEIPGIFGVNLEKSNEIDFILSLGYDINCPNFFESGFNVIMSRIHDRKVTIPIVEALVERGLNIDYQAPKGDSALSCAIISLPIRGWYDYEEPIINARAAIAETIANASSAEICGSEKVQAAIQFIKQHNHGDKYYNFLFALIKRKAAGGAEPIGEAMKLTPKKESQGA